MFLGDICPLTLGFLATNSSSPNGHLSSWPWSFAVKPEIILRNYFIRWSLKFTLANQVINHEIAETSWKITTSSPPSPYFSSLLRYGKFVAATLRINIARVSVEGKLRRYTFQRVPSKNPKGWWIDTLYLGNHVRHPNWKVRVCMYTLCCFFQFMCAIHSLKVYVYWFIHFFTWNIPKPVTQWRWLPPRSVFFNVRPAFWTERPAVSWMKNHLNFFGSAWFDMWIYFYVILQVEVYHHFCNRFKIKPPDKSEPEKSI